MERQTQRKMDILQRLQREIYIAVNRTASVEELYAIFQTFFREYMLMYQHSKDLRFMPIAFVEGSSILIGQARSHVASIGVMECHPVTVASNRYEDVILTYANLMYAYGIDDGEDGIRTDTSHNS